MDPVSSPQIVCVCAACGGGEFGDPLVASEQMFGSGRRFGYLPCRACGTLTLCDRPQDPGAHYPAEYYSFALDPERVIRGVGGRVAVSVVRSSVRAGRLMAAARALPVRRARSLVAALRAMRAAGMGPRSRVVDVGSGDGVMVQCLAAAGLPEPFGVDPFARERPLSRGARVVTDWPDRAGWADVVSFHHSLEHVTHPLDQLRKAIDALVPGGRVVVRVPCVDSHAYRHYGASWVGWDAPRHVFVPSREGLRRLARRAGLEVECHYDDSTSMQFWASELYQRGLPLMDSRSRVRSPWRFRDVCKAPWWAWRARILNARGDGDATVWVLRRA